MPVKPILLWGILAAIFLITKGSIFTVCSFEFDYVGGQDGGIYDNSRVSRL
jgi:hypothetical protein